MSLSISWFRSHYFPHDSTSTAGGVRETGAGGQLTGNLDELFELGYSRFLGKTPYQRFHKIFAYNTGNALSEAIAYFQDSQNREQLAFAFEKVTGDTSTNSATMPSGYITGDFYNVIGLENGISLPNSGVVAATTGNVGFWLWQYIPDGLSSETGCLATLAIAAVTS